MQNAHSLNPLLPLQQRLNETFSLDEIHSLCFDINVDIDNLSGKTKKEKIRALLEYLGRRQQLEILIDRCRTLRPNYDWDFEHELTLFPVDEQIRLTPQQKSKRANQLILLEQVHRFWVESVLMKLTENEQLIDLVWQRYDKAIDHPWEEVLGIGVFDTVSIRTNDQILETFDRLQQTLLILGEPGSGKTVTMLLLVHTLIERARKVSAVPIPIVLRLNSWENFQTSIDEWIVEELVAKYYVPRKIGRAWLEDNELAVFLDGFDELSAHVQAPCCQAINAFRQNHGFVPLVVCSRREEYEQLTVKLKLAGAILLQPLEWSQIKIYLANSNDANGLAIQTILEDDLALLELAQTPLLLRMICQAYDHTSSISSYSSENEIKEKIFNSYTTHALEAPTNLYSSEQSRVWLSWLAKQLKYHNQSLFFIQQIQPSWLPNLGWRLLYLIASRGLLDGLQIGFLRWLVLQLTFELDPSYHISLFDKWSEGWQVSMTVGYLLSSCAITVAIGFLVAIINFVFFETSQL